MSVLTVGLAARIMMDTPHTDDLPALVLPHRFIFHREIAEGGMARVSLVWDREDEAWRALKTLKPDLATRTMHVERFEREGRALMQIFHPNIVRVYDMVYGADTVHLVMEYAEGGSVVQWLERNVAMAPRLAVRLCLQLCSAVEAAHVAGIIHRDIKPHNLVIDRDGNVKLIDFGIARADDLRRHTKTGLGMGTVGYMAPEQHSSAKDVDVRADVYSIGVTLYALLRGQSPAHLFMAEPQDFEGIPAPLVEVIVRAGQYLREDRYASARQMGEALEGVFRLLPPDPENLPQLVPWDVRLVDELPTPVWTATPAPVARSIVPAPRRSGLSISTLPPRDELLSRAARRRDRATNAGGGLWQVGIAGLMVIAGVFVGLVGAGVVTERKLMLASSDLQVTEDQRAQSIAEHRRYLLPILDAERRLDPQQVESIDQLLGTLSSAQEMDRGARDDSVWLLTEALETLAHSLASRSLVAPERQVASVAKDLERDSKTYEVARHRCEQLEAGLPARALAQVSRSLGADYGRCMGDRVVTTIPE